MVSLENLPMNSRSIDLSSYLNSDNDFIDILESSVSSRESIDSIGRLSNSLRSLSNSSRSSNSSQSEDFSDISADPHPSYFPKRKAGASKLLPLIDSIRATRQRS